MTSVVYDQLKTRLLDGTYAPGQKLTVSELRSEFSVSKQPVMDALRSLASDGLVKILPQVGCWVKSYDRKEIENFFVLIGGIEEEITGLAAAQATPDQLAALRRSWEETEHLPARFLANDLGSQYRLANREFHSIIHAMANSEIVTRLSRQAWDLADFLQVLGKERAFQETASERNCDHERILVALENRDVDAAKSAARQHMIHVGQMVAAAHPEPTPETTSA